MEAVRPVLKNKPAGTHSKFFRIALPALAAFSLVVNIGCSSQDAGNSVDHGKPVVQDLSIQSPADVDDSKEE